MNWNIFNGLVAGSSALPPAAWAAALVTTFGLCRLAARLMSPQRTTDIRGRVSQLASGNNLIQLDVGALGRVEVGYIFTVYKRLSFCEVFDETRPTRMVYTPVGQAKVISTTSTTSLCKFRPIRGYSYWPSVGDTAYFTSRVPVGQVIPEPGY